MQITEAARHHMLDRLEESIGREAAMTLAEHLPPTGWSDVARRSDVEQVRTDLGRDIEQLRTDVGRDIEQLRTDLGRDIEQLRTDLGHDIEQVRTDLGHDIEQVRAKLQITESNIIATLHHELRKQTWSYVATLLTLAGLVLAAIRLFGT